MKIEEINAKTILTKSGIPGADYVINPYVGCLHGCKYCYADFMKRFTGHTEEWGEFLDIKTNAAELLGKEKKSDDKGVIMLSSVTDCYNPAEKDYGITRKCLLVLGDGKYIISILSKSALVARDIDIFKKLASIEVGMSFSSHRASDRKVWEPGASDPADKAKALKEIHDAGVKTYLFISPILPGITDMEEIIKLNLGNFDYIMAEALNMVPKVRAKLIPFIESHYPELIELYRGNLDDYFDEKYQEYRSLIEKYGLESRGFHRHGKSIQ